MKAHSCLIANNGIPANSSTTFDVFVMREHLLALPKQGAAKNLGGNSCLLLRSAVALVQCCGIVPTTIPGGNGAAGKRATSTLAHKGELSGESESIEVRVNELPEES
jgi:hypothetical protein